MIYLLITLVSTCVGLLYVRTAPWAGQDIAGSGINRWSKKFDTFAMRRIYIPINVQNSHWTISIIFIVEKNIRYYDSMNGGGDHFLDAARQWVVDEGRVKKNITY